MNAAHLHLMLTHLPVLASVFGALVLLLAIVKGGQDLRRYSLWIFVLAGFAAVPTYLSGQPASALLTKAMPGVWLPDASDQHAEIAVIALAASSTLALIAFAGLTA